MGTNHSHLKVQELKKSYFNVYILLWSTLSDYSGFGFWFSLSPARFAWLYDFLTRKHPFQTKVSKMSHLYIHHQMHVMTLPAYSKKKGCVRISPSYFNSVYRIARKQTDSFCPTPLTCIGVTFQLTPATVDNTLRHRALDRISCQQLGVWTVVYWTLCLRGNQPQMCVCANAEERVCEGLVWLEWCVFMRWFSMLS